MEIYASIVWILMGFDLLHDSTITILPRSHDMTLYPPPYTATYINCRRFFHRCSLLSSGWPLCPLHWRANRSTGGADGWAGVPGYCSIAGHSTGVHLSVKEVSNRRCMHTCILPVESCFSYTSLQSLCCSCSRSPRNTFPFPQMRRVSVDDKWRFSLSLPRCFLLLWLDKYWRLVDSLHLLFFNLQPHMPTHTHTHTHEHTHMRTRTRTPRSCNAIRCMYCNVAMTAMLHHQSPCVQQRTTAHISPQLFIQRLKQVIVCTQPSNK